MAIEVSTVVGPAFMATALVNGDTSGFSVPEIALVKKFEDGLKEWYVVGTTDEEPYFTWLFEMYGGDCRGGYVCEYIVHRDNPFVE